MSRRPSLFAFIAVLAMACLQHPLAHAAETDAQPRASSPGASSPGASSWAATEGGQVRLVSAVLGTGERASLRMGLWFRLKDGWKIYWRTPGDAGYPPKLDWSGSTNVGEARVSWPAPKRFQLAGLQNFGYSHEVILPIDLSIPSPKDGVLVRLAVDYLACAEICVPMRADLALDIPASAEFPSPFAHDIGRTAALIPGDGTRHGLTLDTVETEETGGNARLRVTISAQEKLEAPDLFVEPAEIASFDAPNVTISPDGHHAVLETATAPGTLTRPLAEGPLTLTIVDGARSLEAVRTPVSAVLPPMDPQMTAGGQGTPSSVSVWGSMIAIALLGGLVLNLMPCVLPVLSIKVLGVIDQGGRDPGHIRAAFLASAAGICTSFLALAIAAIGLKAVGSAVGWGIQFQQPVFLAVMIALLLAFAANLWGLYEIRLPTVLMNAGSGGVPHHTIGGHFVSGAFATLLATPCSAPFLGTAIGFALARGPAEILSIFIALGIGMSVPYLVMALWPRAARRLPRPGPWMLMLKKILGLALIATALWLGSVLAAQWRETKTAPGENSTGSIVWVPFDRQAITPLVAQGKTVFIDVTADWCITCKVNKSAVTERGEVARRLSAAPVVAMRADWTRPDDAITAYLASFGRYGIPFNVVYGPNAPQGITLPELLSEQTVTEALDRASATKP